MILSCNSCGKKFVVPENAISASGRLVQCSSCGNKWKQFPINQLNETNIKKGSPKTVRQPKTTTKLTKKNSKTKKIKTKRVGPNLYSPEYLAKKHGLKIKSDEKNTQKKFKNIEKVKFGFYNFLIVFIVITIFILRAVYFSEKVIISNFPYTEVYLDYLFETIRNIKEIAQNFFSTY